MKTWKYSIPFFLTFLLFSTQICAQSYPFSSNEISLLDSLILDGQFEKVEIFLKIKDDQIKDLKLTSKEYDDYNHIKKQFKEIILFINSISKMDLQTTNQLIKQFNGFEDVFKKHIAGQKASELYKEYTNLVNRNELLEALKHYRLARFFKVKYIRTRKKEILIALRQAYEAFSKLQYHESLHYLPVLDSHYKYMVSSTVLDSISKLHSKLQYHFDRENNRKKMWGRDEVKNDLINIHFGIGVITQNAVYNTVINTVEKNLAVPDKGGVVNYNYEIKHLPPSNQFYYLLALSYRIKEKIYVGADFGYSEFQYKSNTLSDLIFFNFKMNMVTYNLHFKYVFRDKVGLRPNIKIGAGYVKLLRPNSTVSILNIADVEVLTYSVSQYTLQKKL